MSYLDQAKNDFERSQGDVSHDFGLVLKECAKIEALLAIAEELQQLNKLLENVVSYSGMAIRINDREA